MAITTRTEESFEQSFRKHIETELKQVAEPLIQKAVQDYEKAIREKIGGIVLSQLATNYECHTNNTNLVITVRNFKG